MLPIYIYIYIYVHMHRYIYPHTYIYYTSWQYNDNTYYTLFVYMFIYIYIQYRYTYIVIRILTKIGICLKLPIFNLFSSGFRMTINNIVIPQKIKVCKSLLKMVINDLFGIVLRVTVAVCESNVPSG